MSVYTEDEFTPFLDECPHPEWWHAVDGHSAELEVSLLIAALIRALQPEAIVETGSAYGQTSALIGEALKCNGHGLLWALEIHAERFQTTRDRCKGLPVKVVHASSLEWTPRIEIDFAWIDSFPEIRADEVRHLHPYFSKRAFVCIHDTGYQHQPLREQVEELASEGLLQPIFLPTPRGLCFARIL